MTSLTFFGGVGEIGGNKILLEDKNTRIFLDFGKSFSRRAQYFEEYINPRTSNGKVDFLTMGLVPDISGVYRDDLLAMAGRKPEKPEIAKWFDGLNYNMKALLVPAVLILFTSLPAFAIQDSLDRAPASQPELQNAQGELVTSLLVDNQVLVVADVTNSQDREQPFVYIVQIEDKDSVVVSLGWIEGALSPNQRLSPALSWTPQNQGTYTITVFVWEAINNPSALSHTLQLDVEVKLAGA